jgi:hypothetical protein
MKKDQSGHLIQKLKSGRKAIDRFEVNWCQSWIFN